MGQPRSIRDGLRRVRRDGGGLCGASIGSDTNPNSKSCSDPDSNPIAVLNTRTNADPHGDPHPNGVTERVTDSDA